MDIQVVYLSMSDDLLSLLDRIRNASSRAVLAVLPRRSRLLTSQIEFILLKRKAADEGKRVAIVSRRLVHTRLGALNRISVFETVKEAGLAHWLATGASRFEKPKRRVSSAWLQEHCPETVHPPKTKRVFQWLALLLLVVYLFVLLSILIPRAVVTYVPVLESKTRSVLVTASLLMDQVSPVGELPLHKASASQILSDSIAVSGQISVPVEKAAGMVTITNQTDQEITIPAGTRLYALNDAQTAYETRAEMVLIAGVGSSAQAAIEAVDAGASGNVSLDTGLVFASSLDDSASLQLIEAIQGGRDETMAGVSEDDVEALKEKIIQDVMRAETITQRTPTDDQILIPESLAILDTEILGLSAEVEQHADILVMVLKIDTTYDYVSEADMLTLTEQIFELENLKEDGAPAPQFTFEVESVSAGSEDAWEIRVEVERRQYLLLDPEEAFNAIRLRPTDSARAILEEMADVETSLEIATTPSWFPLIPFFPFQMTFQPDDMEVK
jgi:hypothetical protein